MNPISSIILQMAAFTMTCHAHILFNKEDCIGIPRKSIRVPARPIEISGAKVNWIDPPLFALLGRPQAVQLRTWEISGVIDAFEKDLLIRNPATVKKEGEVVPPNGPPQATTIKGPANPVR